MDSNVYTDPAVIQESQSVVMAKVNVGSCPEVSSRYNIDALPTIVWMDSNGAERGRQTGALEAAELVPLMQRYR